MCMKLGKGGEHSRYPQHFAELSHIHVVVWAYFTIPVVFRTFPHAYTVLFH